MDYNLFSAAALEPSRWEDALSQLARETNSDFAQLIGFGPALDVGFNWLAGERSGALLSEAVLRLPGEINFRVAAKMAFPNEAIIFERHYRRVIPTLASSAYVETCKEHGIEFGCQTDLHEGPEGFIGLALLRSAATGPTTSSERRKFDHLRREISAALSLQIAIEKEGYRIIAGTFEAMNAAAFILDANMAVRAFTPKAEALLLDGSLRLEDGHLAAQAFGPSDRLDRSSLRDAAMPVRMRRFVVSRRNGKSPVTLQLNALPRREWDLGFSPQAILVARPQAEPTDQAIDVLRSQFALTRSEAEIALLISKGLSRQAVQSERAIGRETIRSHYAAIYSKLGVAREVDAVRVLSSLLD